MINLKNVIENELEFDLYLSKINEIKNYLMTFGKRSFWQIVEYVGGSERRMLRLLEEMVNEKIIYFDKLDNTFYLKNNKSNKHDDYKCKYCNGSTVELKKLNNLIPIMKKIWESKPKPTLLFDQRPVTLKTSLKRVAYFLNNNDVYQKNIVFLGDDDLTGICLALANKDCNVTVLDADKRLIDFINDIAQKYKLKINARVLNVMNKIPKDLRMKFYVLITDPTPEKIPFTVFMNAAIDLLKKEGVLYTSIYSSAMMKNMDLQRIITDMGLYITEMISGFTHYQYIYNLYSTKDVDLLNKYNIKFNDDSICFTETMFRLEKNINTVKLPIEYSSEQMMGKATKRVINNDDAEVAENSVYLTNLKKSMKNSIKETYRS